MEKIDVLDTSTGRLQSLSRFQLSSVLKKCQREARKVLKSSSAAYVVYAVQHKKSDGSYVYHIIPCVEYSASKYEACFGKKKSKVKVTLKPLAVHR